MIGDDGEGPSGCQAVAEVGKRAREPGQLVVDGNSYRLEQAGKIAGAGSGAERPANGSYQVVAGGEGAGGSASHHFTRQPVGPSLVAILAKDAHQLTFGRSIQELGRRLRRVRAHAHVECGTGTEGEAAPFGVQLVRRNPEVEDDPLEAPFGEGRNAVEGGVIPEMRLEPSRVGEGHEPSLCLAQRLGVAIDAGDVRTSLEEGPRVPPSTECAVEYVPSVAKQRCNLARENRRMVVTVPAYVAG